MISEYQEWKTATKEMIDALPDSGSIILVLTQELGRYIRQGIEERRGLDLARKCRMISVNRCGQEDVLMGMRTSIRIDHSLIQRLKSEHLKRVQYLAECVGVGLP